MKISDTISFPTNTEMRLYTARLLRKSRRKEIEVLSGDYELVADAIEGYRVLFSIWLKRFFAGSMTVAACIVLFYQLNKIKYARGSLLSKGTLLEVKFRPSLR